MKRLGSLGVVLPFLALGATACGANTDQNKNPDFKFTMLADFEKSAAFNPNELWSGGFATDADKSVTPSGAYIPGKQVPLVPPRLEPDGTTMSTGAFHMADGGYHTLWGTVLYADLQSSKKMVDISRFEGMSLWARSAGMPGFTVKVAIADQASYDWGQTGTTPDPLMQPDQLCNNLDTTVGGTGCFDDYSVKIYPDGTWRRYDIPFASMTTGGWGLPHAFDLKRAVRIKISALPSTAYDLYFDDIAFYQE